MIKWLVRFLQGFLLFAVIVGGTFFVLRTFFGLRVELDGSTFRPSLSFYSPEEHYRSLEQSRAKQNLGEPVPLPDPVPAVAEAPAPPAPVKTSVPNPPPAATRSAPAAWTDFRGPRRDGRYEGPVSLRWPLPQLWKQPIGLGYASFIAAGGRAFTIEQRRQQEVVTAYDMRTGRELWKNGWDAEFREALGGDGPRATPTLDGNRLYALGATGEFRCLEAATGKQIWARNILTDAKAANLTWGMAAAPLIVDDKVVVLPGGSNGSSVMAYQKNTGEPVWMSLDDQASYVTPMLVQLGGRRQVLVITATRVVGLAPEDGTLLWEHPWDSTQNINISQPVLLSDSRVFLSGGYGMGAAAIELTRDGERFAVKTLWQNNRMKNKFNTSVLHEGHLYGLDEGILACVEGATGQQKWKGGRYGYGQVLLAAGHLIVISESGELALVQATPESYRELSRFQAIEGKTWNHPAVAGGVLLVRNANEMAAFRLNP